MVVCQAHSNEAHLHLAFLVVLGCLKMVDGILLLLRSHWKLHYPMKTIDSWEEKVGLLAYHSLNETPSRLSSNSLRRRNSMSLSHKTVFSPMEPFLGLE